ncbi:MAG: type VI secretion system contractile sheath small subunit [Gemmatimonadetes bacterium]|nr:type VI secretion system contractile sheath small subunit [Gemmatimonadota bacterium]
MAGESVHKKKERVRPPRVHISYEVELNGAQVMKELPFVVGVMADLAGNPKDPPAKLKDRKFVDIDRDNFDDILRSMKPRLAYKVDNKLQDDGSELSVELNFKKLADFRPENVANQVEPLKDLMEIRRQLKALLSKTEGNDRLEEYLNAILADSAVREKLKGTLGMGEEAGGDAAPEGDGGGESAPTGEES